MNNLGKIIICTFVLGAALLCCRRAEARRPSYLILQTPSGPPHGAAFDRFGGDGYGVNTQAYAYGWFGVKSRQHLQKHSGYHGNYRQWTFR